MSRGSVDQSNKGEDRRADRFSLVSHSGKSSRRRTRMNSRVDYWGRRKFLGSVALGAAAGLVELHSGAALAEPLPETTRIRLIQFVSTCQAPLYLSDALLRTEGFTDVQWVRSDLVSLSKLLAAGTVDLGMNFIGPNIMGLEAGDPGRNSGRGPYRLLRTGRKRPGAVDS